jgi:hypothetical protein
MCVLAMNDAVETLEEASAQFYEVRKQGLLICLKVT